MGEAALIYTEAKHDASETKYSVHVSAFSSSSAVFRCVSGHKFTSSDTAAYIAERFKLLKAQWLENTITSSSYTEIISDEAYQKIIAFGWAIVPYIFESIRKEPGHWFAALQAITDANPIDESESGDIEKMTTSWLKWADKHGYK